MGQLTGKLVFNDGRFYMETEDLHQYPLAEDLDARTHANVGKKFRFTVDANQSVVSIEAIQPSRVEKNKDDHKKGWPLSSVG